MSLFTYKGGKSTIFRQTVFVLVEDQFLVNVEGIIQIKIYLISIFLLHFHFGTRFVSLLR